MGNKRKQIRLKDYDYSSDGAYFVTICTHNKTCLFGNIEVDTTNLSMPSIVGVDAHIDPNMLPTIRLSKYGKIAEKYIKLTFLR